eukprot:CAMPEP_0178374240 /NCGR_PEP_ID=MMETSP0689_2-20121128/2275_1 /TAXON_ID=160604 /ORGANISM="Amphidinium massartii, Strain CS-259" /LENGTH=467 /DNA_ID=CAMNT_0019994205 /DNA_START=13 /DNA_END=1416 /DNA_ORIENTATION=+
MNNITRLASAVFGPRNAARLQQQTRQQQEEGDSLVVKNTFFHCQTGSEVKDMRRTSSEPAGSTGSLRTDSASSDTDLTQESGVQVNNKIGAPQSRLKAFAKVISLRTTSIDEDRDAEAEAEQEEEDDWPDTPEPDSRSGFADSAHATASSHQLSQQHNNLQHVHRPGPVGTMSSSARSVPLPSGHAGYPPGLGVQQQERVEAEGGVQAKQAGRFNDSLPPAKSTAIADLQALLQAADHSEHFRYPPGTQVLQWSHSEIANHSGQPTFRAVVAFFRDGVGHHVAGACGRSKRQARQSAADTALALFRCQWAAPPGEYPAACFVDTGALLCSEGTGAMKSASAADVGAFTMACMDGFKGRGASAASPALEPAYSPASQPAWTCDSVGLGVWQALVELPLLGVSHTFSGPRCPTQELAIAEAARRILWYLGHSDYEGFYQPDGPALLAANCKVPDPPASWMEVSAAMPMK